MKLPAHKCSLTITHNAHKDYYDSLPGYLEGSLKDIDPSDLREIFDTGELWEIQWHPDTPVGFCKVYAPTLERALELANEGTA
jgi:hypothetical protein